VTGGVSATTIRYENSGISEGSICRAIYKPTSSIAWPRKPHPIIQQHLPSLLNLSCKHPWVTSHKESVQDCSNKDALLALQGLCMGNHLYSKAIPWENSMLHTYSCSSADIQVAIDGNFSHQHLQSAGECPNFYNP